MSQLFPIDELQVDFTVRSARDPMFAAKRLSNNTFDFGMTAHDLAAAGFLGMIISTLLIFRPCIVICSIRRIPRYQELMRVRHERDGVPIFADPELESVIRHRHRYY